MEKKKSKQITKEDLAGVLKALNIKAEDLRSINFEIADAPIDDEKIKDAGSRKYFRRVRAYADKNGLWNILCPCNDGSWRVECCLDPDAP
jgi:hypothetical protein